MPFLVGENPLLWPYAANNAPISVVGMQLFSTVRAKKARAGPDETIS